ncbi:MAG: hypothetical protein JWP63_701 [Candidatus Solibacter sp.]|nr:hypothetical protein [Candidatus Solibacter sp.]
MPFCASCGAQVEGSFCAKCGTRVGAAASAPGSMPASGPAVQAAPMADNVASALCYALGFITGIIFLVLAPYNRNPTIRFHAFQSIFLSVAFIALRIIVGILIGAMGLFSFFFIYSLISLAGLALWIYMLLMTYQGKTIVLPIIGPIAQQQARV